MGRKAIWKKPGRSVPVHALYSLAAANCFAFYYPLCFLHCPWPPATGPLWVQCPLPGTPLFLIDSNLSFRSWLNHYFITKALLDLQNSTPPSVWVKGQDSGVRMPVLTTRVTFPCLCFLICNIGILMESLNHGNSVSTHNH